MTFNELRKLIQSKFDFEISLEKPYKLCDFRPAYGFLFEEYLKEFRFVFISTIYRAVNEV